MHRLSAAVRIDGLRRELRFTADDLRDALRRSDDVDCGLRQLQLSVFRRQRALQNRFYHV
jgi:hypothetical protein